MEFQEKTISREFFINYGQTKVILYQNSWNFALRSEILYWVRIALKKFTQVLSYVVCTQVRRHDHKQITKKKIRGRKARTLCFRKTSFVHSRSGTYYALLPGYSGLKFCPDVRHCVYWVLAEIWAPDSSHKIGNKNFIRHCQGWQEGSFVCENGWFFSWVNTHLFDLKFVVFCPKFIGDSYMEFQEKTIPGEFFRNYGLTKTILYQNSWNFTLGSDILFWVRIALKKFTQVLSYVVYTQVRRHAHKQITKRRYGGEKLGRFVFGKSVFFHSQSRTYYALLLGYSGLKYLPDVRHCVYWVLAEIWAPDSSHKIGNNFFLHHCHGWKEGSFMCETVCFFSRVNTHSFDLKFVAFCPKFSGDSSVEFQ